MLGYDHSDAKQTLDKAGSEFNKLKNSTQKSLTEKRDYNKVVDIGQITSQIADSMFENIASMEIDTPEGKKVVPSDNSIFMMADSGARDLLNRFANLLGCVDLCLNLLGKLLKPDYCKFS